MKTEVPLGIVHPTMLEPFRVRFEVEDEVITDAEITFNAVYRGVERMLEGVALKKANMITERVCGICSHVHLWNSCRVSELAGEVTISDRAKYIRLLGAELERLHSHTLFFGHAFEVLGHETFGYRSFALREPIMRMMQRFSGNRVHYAIPIIGGVRPRADLDQETIADMKKMVAELGTTLKKFTDRILDDPPIMSRLEDTGTLSKKDAKATHAVGPTARASGIKWDWRKQIPEYEGLEFDMVVLEDGDNKSRVVARVLEVFESIKLINQILDNLPTGDVVTQVKPILDTEFVKSYLEAPRGELYHSLKVDTQGNVRNYRIRPPTTTNLAAVEKACVGDHLTDGILTVVSCDPCICCANRALVVDKDGGTEKMIEFTGGKICIL